MLQKPLVHSFYHFPAVKLLVGCGAGAVIFSLVNFVAVIGLIGAAIALSLTGFVVVVILHRGGIKNGDAATGLHAFAACVYWCSVLAIGGLISHEAKSLRVASAPKRTASSITPAMPAILRGEILRVIRHDSVMTRLLVRGEIDTKAFPRLHETTTLLSVFTAKRDATTKRDAVEQNNTANTDAKNPSAENVYLRRENIHSGMSIYAVVSASLPRRAFLPTDFDEERYAASLGASFLAQAEVRNVAITHERETLQRLTDKAANALERRIDALFPKETAPFALALLTGNTERLSLSTKQEYARAGTVHVLAVSGLHISLLLAMMLVPLAFVRNVALRWVLSVAGVIVFVMLTGAAPSAMRSALMAALFLFVFAVERRPRLLNVIALSILLLLAWQPVLLYSPGFQMSAAAVLGIALTLPIFEQAFTRLFGISALAKRREAPLRSVLAKALGVTCAASLVVAPIVAWYFGVVSLISPLANLAVVPLSSVAMMYTLASAIFSDFWGYGAELFAQTAQTCLLWMNAFNHYASRPQFAALEGRFAFAASLYFSFAMLYCALALSWRILVFRAGVLCVAGILLGMILRPDVPLPQLELIPREQVVAAIVPVPRHLVLLLQDRRSGAFGDASFGDTRPKPDIGLEHYVEEYCLAENDSITVCTTGAASMLIASRIGELLATQRSGKSSQPQTPLRMRVLAQSLLYKDRRFFAALDTLHALGIRVRSASDALKRDSVVRLVEGINNNVGRSGENKRFIAWDAVQGRLVLSGRGQRDSITLPKVTEYRTWSWSGE